MAMQVHRGYSKRSMGYITCQTLPAAATCICPHLIYMALSLLPVLTALRFATTPAQLTAIEFYQSVTNIGFRLTVMEHWLLQQVRQTWGSPLPLFTTG